MDASRVRRVLILALAGIIAVAAPSVGQEAAADSPAPEVTIESITITPDKPAADTLCKMSIRLKNHGQSIASKLGVTVSINGTQVPVYANHLWMFPLPAGEAADLSLYNFWSTETSRPMPKDGKLTVEVTLNEAERYSIEMAAGVETWTPLGAAEGLPSSASVTLEMTR